MPMPLRTSAKPSRIAHARARIWRIRWGVLAPRPLLSGKPRLLCVVHAERADDRGFASLANQPTSRGVAVVGFLHVDEQAGPLHKRQRAIAPDGRVVAADRDRLECHERYQAEFRPGDDAAENLSAVVPAGLRGPPTA